MAGKSTATSDFLTLLEAAAVLGVSTKTVRRRIEQGHLPAFRLTGSRLIRVERADVEKLLTAHRIPTR